MQRIEKPESPETTDPGPAMLTESGTHVNESGINPNESGTHPTESETHSMAAGDVLIGSGEGSTDNATVTDDRNASIINSDDTHVNTKSDLRGNINPIEAYAETLKALEYLLLCPVCKTAAEDPCLLPCQHTMCRQCVREMHKKGDLKSESTLVENENQLGIQPENKDTNSTVLKASESKDLTPEESKLTGEEKNNLDDKEENPPDPSTDTNGINGETINKDSISDHVHDKLDENKDGSTSGSHAESIKVPKKSKHKTPKTSIQCPVCQTPCKIGCVEDLPKSIHMIQLKAAITAHNEQLQIIQETSKVECDKCKAEGQASEPARCHCSQCGHLCMKCWKTHGRQPEHEIKGNCFSRTIICWVIILI